MAGDWIPIRINLRTDPRTIKIAAMIRRTPQHAMGCLCQVWSAANEHSIDGKLLGYTPESIDELTATKGFAAAFASVGWLIVEPDGVRIPDFDRYNSDGAKARLKHSRRVAESRERHKTITPSAQNHHKARTDGSTTEQNRKEKKNSSSSSAAPAVAAAAGISPLLQALHDRGIGEPTASSLIDEGVTGADISAVERASDAGDGPGLWVHRLREAVAQRAATAQATEARQAARAAFDALDPGGQHEKLLEFRVWAQANGLECLHMPNQLVAKWAKFTEWLIAGGVA